MPNKVSYYLSNIDKSFWRKVKMTAFDENISIKKLIIKALTKYFERSDAS